MSLVSGRNSVGVSHDQKVPRLAPPIRKRHTAQAATLSKALCKSLRVTQAHRAHLQTWSLHTACLSAVPWLPSGSESAGCGCSAVEGMGRPLCNLNLLSAALSPGRMTSERVQVLSFTVHKHPPYSCCGLTASYFLSQTYFLFVSCCCGSPTVLKRLS